MAEQIQYKNVRKMSIKNIGEANDTYPQIHCEANLDI